MSASHKPTFLCFAVLTGPSLCTLQDVSDAFQLSFIVITYPCICTLQSVSASHLLTLSLFAILTYLPSVLSREWVPLSPSCSCLLSLTYPTFYTLQSVSVPCILTFLYSPDCPLSAFSREWVPLWSLLFLTVLICDSLFTLQNVRNPCLLSVLT